MTPTDEWYYWYCESCDYKTKSPEQLWCLTCQWAACPECMYVADPHPDCQRHNFLLGE